MATNVFISYRRTDLQHFARLIAEALKRTPGIGRVFIDVDGLEPGQKFAQRLKRALKQSDIALVLMGNDWQGHAAGPQTRIHDLDDFVRLEVRESLAIKGKVIPVIADDAHMPPAIDLPEDIRRITELQASIIRNNAFDRDFDALTDVIFGRKAPGALSSYFNRHWFQWAVICAVLGALITGVLVIAGAATFQAVGSLPNCGGADNPCRLVDAFGGMGQMIVGLAIMALVGTFGPVLLFRRRRRRTN